MHPNLIFQKKRFTVPDNVKQTNIEQKSYQKQIPSTTPVSSPKKNMNKIAMLQMTTTLRPPIQNGTSLKEKDKDIASVPESNNNNSKKEIIMLTRSLLITQNQ